jgi:formamidopyrimidine-DNA glycosylase
MPELPEVITIKIDLRKEILGKKLEEIKITQIYRKIAFTNDSLNQTVKDVFNIGKQIIIEFDNESYVCVHLGMTGRLLLNKTDKYEKAALIFSDNKAIYFSDIRKFGHIKNISKEDLTKYTFNLGVNILEPYNKKKLINKIKIRKIPIKNALLDQSLISGIGNIYATDALYLSKISPTTKANEIEEIKYEVLIQNIENLLKEGIAHRGSSMNRYVDLHGNPGSHQNYFRVYKQKNKICPECASIIKFEKLSGRGNYYCPNCQKS